LGNMDELGEFIANQKKELDETKKQIGNLPDEIFIQNYFRNNFLRLSVDRIVFKERSYKTDSGILIWGHATYGFWSQFKWGTEANAFTEFEVVYDSQNP